jgi:hypothetical protein
MVEGRSLGERVKPSSQQIATGFGISQYLIIRAALSFDFRANEQCTGAPYEGNEKPMPSAASEGSALNGDPPLLSATKELAAGSRC